MEKINAGCYQLIFKLIDNLTMTIGSLGHFVLPEGYYIYTAKANDGLDHIVKRHLKKKKKIRWHIDYLTISEKFHIEKIYIYPNIYNPCLLNQYAIKETAGHEIIPRFGSLADDKCYSHLLYVPKDPNKNIHKIKSAFKQILWRDV